jgi:UPF0716 protein FxsA
MMLAEKQTGPRARPTGLFLLIGLIVVPLAEIAVLIEVGGWLGVGPTLALIVLTAVVGAWLLRRQGFAALRRAQQQIERGVAPVVEVFDGLCLVIAGILLLAPGLLTDVAGALLLLPPLRTFLYRRVRRRLEEQLQAGASASAAGARSQSYQPPPGVEPDPPVIDAEFEEVEPGAMPEPRGSWSRVR